MDELYEAFLDPDVNIDESGDTRLEERERLRESENHTLPGWSFDTYLKCSRYWRGSYTPPQWVVDLAKQRGIDLYNEPKN